MIYQYTLNFLTGTLCTHALTIWFFCLFGFLQTSLAFFHESCSLPNEVFIDRLTTVRTGRYCRTLWKDWKDVYQIKSRGPWATSLTRETICYHLPLKKSMDLHLNKSEFPILKDAIGPVVLEKKILKCCQCIFAIFYYYLLL